MDADERAEFERLLSENKVVVERFINFRLPTCTDADDVIQNTYLNAVRHFADLKSADMFRYWLLGIAKNECSLWYRQRYRRNETTLEAADEISEELSEVSEVFDTLNRLPPLFSEIIRLYYSEDKSQSEISTQLNIPLGTVKSRLYNAKKRFRDALPADIKSYYMKGHRKMVNIMGFPDSMPELRIERSGVPYFEVNISEQSFIIPKLGNKNSEATYRYPDKKLALVSTCYVPKKAVIHEVEGVEVRRDTFNVRANKLYKNEAIWFTQLTDEYMRDLGTIASLSDDEYPTAIYTFLEEDYDVIVNGHDRIHGLPVILKENPAYEDGDGIHINEYNTRYTMGVYNVTVGARSFETVKVINVQNHSVFGESYFDRAGRLVLLRWYETRESIADNANYSVSFIEKIQNNAVIKVDGVDYVHIEDRISEYAM